MIGVPMAGMENGQNFYPLCVGRGRGAIASEGVVGFPNESEEDRAPCTRRDQDR